MKLNSRARMKELRELQSPELLEQIEKLAKEAFDLRLKSATESVANPSRFRQIRKDVARLHTILRERETKSAAGAKK